MNKLQIEQKLQGAAIPTPKHPVVIVPEGCAVLRETLGMRWYVWAPALEFLTPEGAAQAMRIRETRLPQWFPHGVPKDRVQAIKALATRADAESAISWFIYEGSHDA